MKYLFFSLLVSLQIFSIPNPSVLLRGRDGAGLFSTFTDVAAALQAYEKGSLRGLEVDFAESGIYYEPSYGPNWWNYYCEPISLGDVDDPLSCEIGDIEHLAPKKWKSKHVLHSLIQKYIHFRSEIVDQVEEIVSHSFSNTKVIGVHYRGTDWLWENDFRRVSYSIFAKRVKQAAKTLRTRNYKVFVATDETHFVEYMKKAFPGKVIVQEGIYRSVSDKPPHKDDDNDAAKQGEEAIIDCLLLSRCNFLIGTCSNLSQWATFFNPNIPFRDLSARPSFDIVFEG